MTITDWTVCSVLVCVRREHTPLKQHGLAYSCIFIFIYFYYYDVTALNRKGLAVAKNGENFLMYFYINKKKKGCGKI